MTTLTRTNPPRRHAAPLPDGAALSREIHAQAGLGIAAHIRQVRGLEILRMRVDHPALILVDRGVKSVRSARGASVRAVPGQGIVLAGNQTVDFTNAVTQGLHYEARWLVFDPMLLEDAFLQEAGQRIEPPGAQPRAARLVATVSPGLAEAFERARQALVPSNDLPFRVVRQRLLEVAMWLLEAGIVVRSQPLNPGTSVKVRALIADRLDAPWRSEQVGDALALSGATLRRRLAAEGTSLTELLVDARMATALTLLQATTRPVSDIAAAVGYESASRFSVRFRQRFGFAPTAVRGHERTD